MLELADISETLTAHHISNEQFNKLITLLKGFIFKVNGTLSIEKAFVTGGGSLLKKSNPKR